MSEQRRWYGEPETFIAVAALVVSLSAVIVGIYEASLQRAHDRADVWPHVEMSTFTSANGASVSLSNHGIGPAIIKTISVTVDGRPYRNWTGVVQALLSRPVTNVSSRTVLDEGIRAGDRVELLTLLPAQMPDDFWTTIGRIALTVCYSSVFGQSWEVTGHLGTRNTWRAVDACPAEAPGADF